MDVFKHLRSCYKGEHNVNDNINAFVWVKIGFILCYVYDGCVTLSASIKCSVLKYSNLSVIHKKRLEKQLELEGEINCIYLHSSKAIGSISGVSHISNSNNCKYTSRRVRAEPETSVEQQHKRIGFGEDETTFRT